MNLGIKFLVERNEKIEKELESIKMNLKSEKNIDINI